MDIIDKITMSQMKKDLPEFRVGDSVTVGCIITETKNGKSKERVHRELTLLYACMNLKKFALHHYA